MRVRLRDERGQALALTVAAIAALVGVAALVLDVGSWFRADRRLQAVADASALAGAQALPADPARAVDLAMEYAAKNGGGVAPQDVVVQQRGRPNDTIVVVAAESAPGIFSRVLSVFDVEIRARAAASARPLGSAFGAAPIVVTERHPMLQCQPEPCFGQTTTLNLLNLKDPESANGSGAFGLLNFESSSTGTVSTGSLASWIRSGYQSYVGASSYRSASGARFNSSDITSALSSRIGTDLLLPIYRSLTGTGQNAVYQIVGWVGFRLTGFTGSGSGETITGMFTRVTWEGIESQGGSNGFGATSVALVE